MKPENNEAMAAQEVAVQAVQPNEIDIIKAKSAAQFALTPIGQTIRQFEVQQRMAQMYAQSTIIPETYRGNLGNCVIAIDMAMRMNANPLMIIQNLYIVNGNPSFSSKFLIATINASRRYSPLRYEFRGTEGTDSYACRVLAYEIGDTEHKEPLYGDWVSMKMAKDEGWTDKKGSKWRTMPNQMLRYRAAAFWQRAYCPEISMGLMTTEEYQDMNEVSADYRQEINAEANKQTITIPEVDVKEHSSEETNDDEKPIEISVSEEEKPLGATKEVPLFMK